MRKGFCLRESANIGSLLAMNTVDWIVFCYPRGRRHLSWDAVVYFTKNGERNSIHFNNLYQQSASDIYDPESFLRYWSDKTENKKRVGWAGFDSYDLDHIVKWASQWSGGWRDFDDSKVKVRFNNWLLIDPWAGKIVDEDGDAIYKGMDSYMLLEGWSGIRPSNNEKADDNLFHMCLSPTPYKIKKWSGYDVKMGYKNRNHAEKVGKISGGITPENRWMAAFDFIEKNKDTKWFNVDQIKGFISRRGHLPPQYNPQAIQKCAMRRMRKRKNLSKSTISFLKLVAAGNSIIQHVNKTQ